MQSGEIPASAWVLEAAMLWQRKHPGLQQAIKYFGEQAPAILKRARETAVAGDR